MAHAALDELPDLRGVQAPELERRLLGGRIERFGRIARAAGEQQQERNG